MSTSLWAYYWDSVYNINFNKESYIVKINVFSKLLYSSLEKSDPEKTFKQTGSIHLDHLNLTEPFFR